MEIVIKRGKFQVSVLADHYVRVPTSLNPSGYHRITSLVVVFPRIVLAELNTHRLLSRNSASSRAIPATVMRQLAIENPFVPDRYPRLHKGMQASDWVESTDEGYEYLNTQWLGIRDQMVAISRRLEDLGVSKQLSNRFLEPVMMHKVLITATEWENFLALRADPPAQNEIRILAEMVLEAMNSSTPIELMPGEWHMPFGLNYDSVRLIEACTSYDPEVKVDQLVLDEYWRRIVVARCARVSYNNFEGKDDYLADLKLYDQLASSGHWSPFEHVARAMTGEEYEKYSHTTPDGTEHGWCGNFRGFVQYRKTFPRNVENRPDSRLNPLK